MIIRVATETDRPAIAAVQSASWRSAYTNVLSKEYLDNRLDDDIAAHWRQQEIKDGDVVMVAEDGDLIGFIAIWVRPTPYIDNLHVLPEFRSQGIGRMLMRTGAKALLDAGQRTAYLWVVAGNTSAIRFYERLGGSCPIAPTWICSATWSPTSRYRGPISRRFWPRNSRFRLTPSRSARAQRRRP